VLTTVWLINCIYSALSRSELLDLKALLRLIESRAELRAFLSSNYLRFEYYNELLNQDLNY